jgi:hypothetical protein
MIKKALFILFSFPHFLPSCPENECLDAKESVYEEVEKKDTCASAENVLPLSKNQRPQVIVSPIQEETN